MRLAQLLPALLLTAIAACASSSRNDDLVAALRKGGIIIVMRHAEAPEEPPAPGTANPDNIDGERQLDQTGQATATAMGDALRDLEIPVGRVLTSAAYRARQTARYAGWQAEITPEIGAPAAMAEPVDPEAPPAWLRRRITQAPAPGANDVLITHSNYIEDAFDAENVASGEALVFRPDGAGDALLLARVPIETWPTLVQD